MSSYAALVLCVCCSWLRLLKIDHQRAAGLSRALWIPSLWFLYCATRPLDEWFQHGQFAEMGGGASVESGQCAGQEFSGLF